MAVPASYLKADIYAAIFENSPVAIIVANNDGLYVDANAAAAALFGCSREQLVGRKVTDFVAPLRNESAKQLWTRFQAEGLQAGTIIISRADGTDRLLRYSARTNFLPGLHVSFLRDITGES